MQTLTEADNATIDKLQDLNGNFSLGEKAARQHIIDSFTGKMPSLIPFALENRSIRKLASYLLKYTSGSEATLYQYVFGIHRFSKWIQKSPDRMVEELSLNEKAKTW